MFNYLASITLLNNFGQTLSVQKWDRPLLRGPIMIMYHQFRLYKTMELQINWSVKLSDNNPLWLMAAGNTSPAQSLTSPSREYADTSGGQSKHDSDNFKLHIYIINIFLCAVSHFGLSPIHTVLKCRIRKRLLHYA